MDAFLFQLIQGFVVVAVVWVKITDLGRRVDRLEKRVDDFLNHRVEKE